MAYLYYNTSVFIDTIIKRRLSVQLVHLLRDCNAHTTSCIDNRWEIVAFTVCYYCYCCWLLHGGAFYRKFLFCFVCFAYLKRSLKHSLAANLLRGDVTFVVGFGGKVFRCDRAEWVNFALTESYNGCLLRVAI